MAVAVMNPQDGFDDDLIGRVPLLTPASVGKGLERVAGENEVVWTP